MAIPLPLIRSSVFQISGLQQALGNALGIPLLFNLAGQFIGLQDAIYQSQLLQLVSLDADGDDISNLAGLQYATNLQFLDLANNSLTSLLLPSASGALYPAGPGAHAVEVRRPGQ